MKLTELQKYRINQAHNGIASVLAEIKRKHLSQKEIEKMKMLERSVQELEIFRLNIRE